MMRNGIDNSEIAQAQYQLVKATDFFLYASFLGASPASAFYQHKFIANHLLIQAADAFSSAGIKNVAACSLKQTSTLVKHGEALSTLHAAWAQHQFLAHSVKAASKKLPMGRSYQQWLADGGDAPRFSPVHKIRDLLQKEKTELFLRAIVHGSVATLDDTPGFSDLDLAFVVSKPSLCDPSKLIRLRQVAAQLLVLTYSFDPFMHHGPYYISETDLACYPEAMFPSILFHYGVDLIDNSAQLEIGIRPSFDITEKMFAMFEGFFSNWPANPFRLKDSYELEWVLGSVMLMPALYLQAITGEFRYKRDTFPIAEKDFSSEEWEPVKTASMLRQSLSQRPKSPWHLIFIARNLKWPGLLQSYVRRTPSSVKRAKETEAVLGPDYPQRVMRLIASMRSKIRTVR